MKVPQDPKAKKAIKDLQTEANKAGVMDNTLQLQQLDLQVQEPCITNLCTKQLQKKLPKTANPKGIVYLRICSVQEVQL
jgi:hypothetical protein